MDYFDHEKMDVYNLAVDFVAVADEIASSLPRGRAYLVDQLRRACTSVTLNIAEGAGEFAGDEKARFYRMAKRSATECAGVLDVCRRLGLASQQLLDAGRELLLRIVSMLIPLIRRAAGSSGTGMGTGTE
jgi:four helix bundle protein